MKLEVLQKQNRKAAYEEFVKGAWANRSAEEMLSLAKEARMDTREADRLIAKIHDGQAKVALADQAARLRKEDAETKTQHEKISERNGKEIVRLNGEILNAWSKHKAAFDAMCKAESAVRDLHMLKKEGLLPVPHKEVTRLEGHYELAEKRQQAQSARVDASNERYRLQGLIEGLEYKLQHLPLTPTRDHDKERLKDGLERARRELVEAEAKLKDAEAAEEKAKKA